MHNCTALKGMFIACYTTVLPYMVSFLLNDDSAGRHSFFIHPGKVRAVATLMYVTGSCTFLVSARPRMK